MTTSPTAGGSPLGLSLLETSPTTATTKQEDADFYLRQFQQKAKEDAETPKQSKADSYGENYDSSMLDMNSAEYYDNANGTFYTGPAEANDEESPPLLFEEGQFLDDVAMNAHGVGASAEGEEHEQELPVVGRKGQYQEYKPQAYVNGFRGFQHRQAFTPTHAQAWDAQGEEWNETAQGGEWNEGEEWDQTAASGVTHGTQEEVGVIGERVHPTAARTAAHTHPVPPAAASVISDAHLQHHRFNQTTAAVHTAGPSPSSYAYKTQASMSMSHPQAHSPLVTAGAYVLPWESGYAPQGTPSGANNQEAAAAAAGYAAKRMRFNPLDVRAAGLHAAQLAQNAAFMHTMQMHEGAMGAMPAGTMKAGEEGNGDKDTMKAGREGDDGVVDALGVEGHNNDGSSMHRVTFDTMEHRHALIREFEHLVTTAEKVTRLPARSVPDTFPPVLGAENTASVSVVETITTVPHSSETKLQAFPGTIEKCAFPGCTREWASHELSECGEEPYSLYVEHYILKHIIQEGHRVKTEEVPIPTNNSCRHIAQIYGSCDMCCGKHRGLFEWNVDYHFRWLCAQCHQLYVEEEQF